MLSSYPFWGSAPRVEARDRCDTRLCFSPYFGSVSYETSTSGLERACACHGPRIRATEFDAQRLQYSSQALKAARRGARNHRSMPLQFETMTLRYQPVLGTRASEEHYVPAKGACRRSSPHRPRPIPFRLGLPLMRPEALIVPAFCEALPGLTAALARIRSRSMPAAYSKSTGRCGPHAWKLRTASASNRSVATK